MRTVASVVNPLLQVLRALFETTGSRPTGGVSGGRGAGVDIRVGSWSLRTFSKEMVTTTSTKMVVMVKRRSNASGILKIVWEPLKPREAPCTPCTAAGPCSAAAPC